MEDLLPLEAVIERDIDMLLLEEASVSEAFQIRLFLHALGSTKLSISRVRAWHSISDAELGESDLIVLGDLVPDGKAALLVENKIDALPQPDQAARYQSRGEAGLSDGRWGSFRTVLVAPERYLKNDREAGRYNVTLSYEVICDWLSQSGADEARMSHKVMLLRQAIEQNRRGYNPKMDEEVTRFFHEYWMLSLRLFPELNVEGPRPRTAQSTWISFRPEGISDDNRKIWHKMGNGVVDLELPFLASEVPRLTAKFERLLPKDIRIVTTKKSSALRIKVPSLDPLKPLAEQEHEALVAMKAALRLSSLMNVLTGT
jgi:hypothetical protein